MAQKPTETGERQVEEEFFEQCLREHGQLADEECAELPAGATHQVTTDDTGERHVVRKRFSAF